MQLMILEGFLNVRGYEYVVFDRVHGYARGGGICHKENCKYCAEREKVNAP